MATSNNGSKKRKSIFVGVFVRDNDQVPAKMKGKAIYYSPEFQKFAIYDKNTRKTIDFFPMNTYRVFMDAHLIEPDNHTIGLIEDEYDRWAESQQPQDDMQQQYDGGMNNENVIIPSDRTVMDYADTMDIQEQKRSKDPTRHVGSYFMTIFILAIAAILGRTVIVPLIQQMMLAS